jgi:medium-chain acyl-[acyl-carrier-protein] hydrolase
VFQELEDGMKLSKEELERWLHIPKPIVRPSLRLYAFPFAGGTGAFYHSWARQLPPQVELCGILLPGRHGRLKEPLYTRMGELVETLAHIVSAQDDVPFLFFGHSMGAVLAFELAHHLRQTDGMAPCHLIVSGHRAPQLPNPRPDIFRLPTDRFIEALKLFNGTPAQLLEDRELMELLLPALRADFEMLSQLVYVERGPLPFPITAFGGLLDSEAQEDEIHAWSAHTNKTFEAAFFEGGHFFVSECLPEVIKRVCEICVRAAPEEYVGEMVTQ